jgi:MEMO1 family protein
MSDKIRKPAVAGMFYPKDPKELSRDLEHYLAQAPTNKILPKAIIVPHAGYVYSGAVAAVAYQLVKNNKNKITRVILLGPSHRVAFPGLALSTADYYETPFGNVSIDKELAESLTSMAQITYNDAAHAAEHSLEVHVPFLQHTLNNFTLLPLVVGDARADEVSDVLLKVWGGEETLIVISTDLSHFEDYETAQAQDKKTCSHIEQMNPECLEYHDACGRIPVSGILVAAKTKGLKIATLDLRNSGDTAGSKDRVVGYGSWAFY